MVADEPLMFSKVNHVFHTTDSYYIASGSKYVFEEHKDALVIDSSGSLYLLVDDGLSTSFSYVIKIAAIGDATATIATVSATSVNFDPWGLTLIGSNLYVGVVSNAISFYNVGIITMATSTLNQTGNFCVSSGLPSDIEITTLKHITGTKFVSNHKTSS